jgi:predicted nucleic acid-binding Zn ribbon protein
MKILIPGKKPKTYSFICEKCGCFFEFEHGIRIEDNKAYATCPCCQESCWCIIGLKDTSFVKYI